ncbi:FecR family protein [Algoriphagus sp. PAP.12]|uniref:FecR family protein n=1 Tax=Algoriphagus sp. PAP.12 TaxID=2996678 RepID=UPI00227A3EBA|nr:FecR family protein [Algoriphagus sp. PAP.12]
MEKEKLIKFLNGACTPQEEEQIRNWLDQQDSQEELSKMFQNSWDSIEQTSQGPQLDKILHKVHQQIGSEKGKKVRSINSNFIGIAASLILFAALAFMFFDFGKSTPEQALEIATVYKRETKSGEKLKLRLPDQTYVILNSNSSIEFDSDYGKEKRYIKIQGEAYFDVASNKEKPFIVDSGELHTTALGTEFNVLSRNGIEEIALTEGRVKVEIEDTGAIAGLFETLDPGQKATFKENDSKIINSNFDPSIVTAWKEGRIQFKRKRLKDIFSDLQNWYGVEFQVPLSLNMNRKVSGEFNNESLKNILEGLSFSMGFNYSIQDNSVIISM